MFYWTCTQLRQISRVLIVISSIIGTQYAFTKQPPTKITVGPYQLKLATTPESRAKGLQGIRRIPKNTGMLFIYPIPTEAIYWMYGCYTGMDIVFLDINSKVQGVLSAIPPTDRSLLPEQYPRYTAFGSMRTNQVRYTTLPKTAYVVEVPLGDGAHFIKNSAHLITSVIATAKIKAN